MAFNTNSMPAEYTASSGQTAFPFTFKIFETSDLLVYKTPVGRLADDTLDLQTLSTNYTVSIDGDNGGTVTFLVGTTSGDKVTIIRNLQVERDVEYQTNGDLLAYTLNQDQDYQTYLISGLEQKIGKALRFPNSAQGLSGELPSPSPDNYIRWNSTGTALENDDVPPPYTTLAEAAVTSAAAALISETNAATSEDNAAISAAAALISEQNADASEASALSAKDTAVAAQIVAVAKADEATTQAGIATTKASEALTSRNEAEGFRDEAEGFAESIDPSNLVHKTGDETIAGVKSFTSSPTTPTPTTDYQVANKKYVDDKVNKPCFSAYKNDGNQSITSDVSTKVTFTTEEYDRTGAYDITNSRFTPSIDGIYHVISQVDVSGGTDVQLRLYKNGSPVRGARSTWTFTANSKFQFSCDIELVGSNYVEMYITITGSTPVVYPSKSTFFQAHYVRS